MGIQNGDTVAFFDLERRSFLALEMIIERSCQVATCTLVTCTAQLQGHDVYLSNMHSIDTFIAKEKRSIKNMQRYKVAS